MHVDAKSGLQKTYSKVLISRISGTHMLRSRSLVWNRPRYTAHVIVFVLKFATKKSHIPNILYMLAQLDGLMDFTPAPELSALTRGFSFGFPCNELQRISLFLKSLSEFFRSLAEISVLENDGNYMEIPEKIWDFHGITQHCMAFLAERDETTPSVATCHQWSFDVVWHHHR